MLQIPLVEGINSKIETVINDLSYTLTVNWNERFGYYSMDIELEGSVLMSGILLTSGVDICNFESIPLKRVYCVNKIEGNKDFGFTGLGDDGLVVIVEDSDLEG